VGRSFVNFTWRWTTVAVNQYSGYSIDPAWGPGFLKICG
jgi:hypothetical protein